MVRLLFARGELSHFHQVFDSFSTCVGPKIVVWLMRYTPLTLCKKPSDIIHSAILKEREKLYGLEMP